MTGITFSNVCYFLLKSIEMLVFNLYNHGMAYAMIIEINFMIKAYSFFKYMIFNFRTIIAIFISMSLLDYRKRENNVEIIHQN